MTAEHPSSRLQRIHRIQLEAYDDVVSVKDRLQFVETGRVILIFPPKAKILQRKLDLVLIQREAARRDLRLALVTKDMAVAENARDLDLSVFYTVEEARTRRWKTPHNKVFVDRRDRPKPQHETYELMLAASRLKSPPGPLRQLQVRITRGLFFGVAMLAILFGMYAVVPSATVTLIPARDELNITINIIADPSVTDAIPESLRVPATIQRRLEEASVTIETTGRRPAQNSLAEGIVTFTNNTNLAQFIPAGTLISTSTIPPVYYVTQADAALAARVNATVNVAIRALPDNPPLSGNQPANAIDRVQGELSESISVRNQNPTYGEGVREIAFVTAADQERLQNLARQQIRHNARNNLLVSLDESQYLIVPDSIIIIEERDFLYSADINQPAETVSLTLKATVEATIINLKHAEVVAFANLSRYITEGRILNERQLTYRRGEIQQVFDDGRVAFQMRVEGTTYVNINEQQVKDRLTGLSKGEALAVLEREYLLDPRRPPQIKTWPGILQRMPIIPIRIQVEVIQ